MFPEILLTSAVFLSALLSAFLCLLLNVGILKRRLKRWNSNATIYFIMSLGNAISVNRHKKERWQVVHGYSEDESAAILHRQRICLIEMLAGFAAGTWLLARFFDPQL